MKFSFVENIQPYENSWEYSLYKYDDVIQMGDSDSYICTARIIMLEPQEVYVRKNVFGKKFYVVIEDFMGSCCSKEEFEESIFEFVKEEIVQYENKDQIVVLFS